MGLRVLLAILLILFGSSCSLSDLNPANLWGEDEQPDLYAAREPPIEVRVASADADAQNLMVDVVLKPKTVLETNNIAVGVIGLNDGDSVTSEVKLLKDVLDVKTLSPDQEYSLTFNLPSEGINEYQVKCSWGDDVRKLVTEGSLIEVPEEKKELHVAADLEIESSKLLKEGENCGEQDCEIFYKFDAVLVNNSEREISEVDLGLGIFWREAEGEVILPQDMDPLAGNEQLIPLKGVNFIPGARKQLKLKLDRGVPIVEGGEFVPNLRIVDFKKNEQS